MAKEDVNSNNGKSLTVAKLDTVSIGPVENNILTENEDISNFGETAAVSVSAGSGLNDLYAPLNNYLHKGNPIVLITLTVVILFYYFLFRSITPAQQMQPMPETAGTSILEILMWGMFIFLILINGLQYFFSIDAKTAIKNLFSEKPEVEITVYDDEKIDSKPVMNSDEVFHVPKNIYNYDQAKDLCKAYDSRLATFEEVQKAYDDGAEWCTYGWSEGQYALYPTQMKTWKKLNGIGAKRGEEKKFKGHEHDCGRPGINGGFIKNENVEFGVNCFGSKPGIRPEEESQMGEKWPQIPLTKDEKEKKKQVEFYKKNIPDIMISPYNYDNWTSI
tara:strand:- start:3 stop:998 length:996 start_codon:yes stop_codon:yes gene_type:complete